mgnify:CR=1 FL=1
MLQGLTRFRLAGGVSRSHLPVLVPNRGKAKKWEADFVQLFVNEYQHSNPLDHSIYQFRRVKYARKGLVAPRALDYDTPEDEVTDDIDKYIPLDFDKNKLKDNFLDDVLEAYKDYRREQKIAKDDPRSPFYFEDENEAKDNALGSAVASAIGKAERRLLDAGGATISLDAKHKIMTDPAPPKYIAGLLTSYIPEPDPVTYPHWDPYIPEFPLAPEKHKAPKKQGMPVGLPKWREPERQEDGSAVARGSRKDAVALATIRRGTGLITINHKPMLEYFPRVDARDLVLAPFLVTECLMSFDADIRVRGGGVMGK